MSAGLDFPAAAPSEPWWRRRLIAPLRTQLRQGIAPERLALTLGIGTACALFPFLGFTSLLNLAAGLFLRLNHAILQTLNQLLGLAQVALILVYVRLGEFVWQASSEDRFTVVELIATFRDASLGDFLARFGWAGVHALTAWLITSPVIVGVLYLTTLPALRRLLRDHSA